MGLRIVSFTFLVVFTVLFSSFHITNAPFTAYPLKVYYNNLNEYTKKEIDCLAQNIYFESAHEPKEGKVAVAFVTLNRVYSGYFPGSICDVVKQAHKNICQFSWYCESKAKHIATGGLLTASNSLLYNEIQNLAIHVYANYEKLEDPSKGALFYHADYVDPKWKNMEKTAVIGRHIFYNRKDNKNDSREKI